MSFVHVGRKPYGFKQAFARSQPNPKMSVSEWVCDVPQIHRFRARSKPNLLVSDGQYKDAFHSLLVADPPMLDLQKKMGPVLVKHPKQVTPGHLVSLEQLWYQLISSGCKQLVLQSIKISSALHRLVCERTAYW